MRANWGDARLPERFWDKVSPEPNSGCWLWAGAVNHGGYGKTFDKKRHLRAHRFAYERIIGAIADGLQLDHLCRTPSCVNPAHLEAVTPRVNTLRSSGLTAENARRTHGRCGHPLSGDNLRVDAKQKRTCRLCTRANNTRQARERRHARLARVIATHDETETP